VVVLQWCSGSDVAQTDWWWFCRGSDPYPDILSSLFCFLSVLYVMHYKLSPDIALKFFQAS
jgi:hypothetical protein